MKDFSGAGKPAGALATGTPRLADGPDQPGLHWIDGSAQLVPVEAQARFQAQGIACAQADGFNLWLRQQQARDPVSAGRRQGQLEAILTGVNCTGIS